MAKFDTPDPLPEPESDQAVVLSTNRFGQFYSRRQSRGYRGGVDKPLCFPDVPAFVFRHSNWGILSYYAHRWKTVLNAGQKLAWAVLASLVNWQNYKGQTRYESGFSMFMAFNLMQPAAARVGADNPPGAWDPTETPVIRFVEFFPPDDVFLHCEYPVQWPWYNIRPRAVVTRDPKLAGAFPFHFRTYWCNDPVDRGDHIAFDIFISCPLWPNSTARQTTIGIQYVDNSSGGWSNFSWFHLG